MYVRMYIYIYIFIYIYVYIYIYIQAKPLGRSEALSVPVEAPLFLRRSSKSIKSDFFGACAGSGGAFPGAVRVWLRPERYVYPRPFPKSPRNKIPQQQLFALQI